MAQEIERKFLVTGNAWRRRAVGRRCRQAYLGATAGVIVRVRLLGRTAWLTVKGPASHGRRVRPEFEYAIPRADAEALLALVPPAAVIEKTRYLVRHAGHRWSVDVFAGANAGLVLAEIELAHPDAPVARPPWLGAEVTADPRYDNARLARRPFAAWGRAHA